MAQLPINRLQCIKEDIRVIREHPTWENPIQDTLVVTRFQNIVGKHSSGQRFNLSLIEL
jgi:hypothetical protein